MVNCCLSCDFKSWGHGFKSCPCINYFVLRLRSDWARILIRLSSDCSESNQSLMSPIGPQSDWWGSVKYCHLLASFQQRRPIMSRTTVICDINDLFISLLPFSPYDPCLLSCHIINLQNLMNFFPFLLLSMPTFMSHYKFAEFLSFSLMIHAYLSHYKFAEFHSTIKTIRYLILASITWS